MEIDINDSKDLEKSLQMLYYKWDYQINALKDHFRNVYPSEAKKGRFNLDMKN